MMNRVTSTPRRSVVEWTVVVVAVGGALIWSMLAVVDSSSMSPSLCHNDYIIVWGRGASRPLWSALRSYERPERGDIVVIEPTLGSPWRQVSPRAVKRVVAVGGDTVRLYRGTPIVNGQPIDEPYVVRREHREKRVDFWPLDLRGAGLTDVRVEPHRVFVLGDNREESSDSRTYGSIPVTDIAGTVTFPLRMSKCTSNAS